jgi:ubiquinone/menaquinone biosynthesis C-methylase UbiE
MAKSREPFTRAADAYDRHVGRYGAQLAAGLVEAADIRPGQRVLDVGCGPGSLTRALADRTGENNVAAIDLSPGFVDACRARVPGADVRTGRAEELPSPRTPSTLRSRSSSCRSWTTATPASPR